MNYFESNLFNCFSATLETDSTAFLGAHWAQRIRSSPRKAVDLDHRPTGMPIFLWEHRHAGT